MAEPQDQELRRLQLAEQELRSAAAESAAALLQFERAVKDHGARVAAANEAIHDLRQLREANRTS